VADYKMTYCDRGNLYAVDSAVHAYMVEVVSYA
jgi:hypothetical protein